jgi:Mg-chelatase subunit ChlD
MGLFGRSNKKVHKSVKFVRAAEPATSLTKINAKASSLSKKAEAANARLTASGLMGVRGKSVLVLDYSGSMSPDYQSGAVQELTERALAFGLQFASDEKVTLIPFADNALPHVDVTLDNYAGVVDREVVQRHYMGSTNLTDALKHVRSLSEQSDELIFCTVVTDGEPNSTSSTKDIVCELAGYPVFIKFLALGQVNFLTELDNLGPDKRLLDNVNAQFFSNISAVGDEEYATAMVKEWPEYIKAAQDAGVLTS